MTGEIVLDTLSALRDAVMSEATVPGLLEQWQGEPAVFTRSPVPQDAPDLCVVIMPPAATLDADGLTSRRPIVTLDIAVYGRKGAPGSAEDQTRTVERCAGLLQQLFHRNRFSVQPDGFSVIGIVVAGPMPAPVDDDATVGQIISVTLRLRRV